MIRGLMTVCESLTVILLQFNKDHCHTMTINSGLLDAMDPYDLGLFEEEDANVPIIRIFLALAARTTFLKPPHFLLPRRKCLSQRAQKPFLRRSPTIIRNPLPLVPLCLLNRRYRTQTSLLPQALMKSRRRRSRGRNSQRTISGARA